MPSERMAGALLLAMPLTAMAGLRPAAMTRHGLVDMLATSASPMPSAQRFDEAHDALPASCTAGNAAAANVAGLGASGF